MRKLLSILILTLACATFAQTTEKAWCLVTDKDVAIEVSKVSYLLAASTETFDIVCTDGTTIGGVSSVLLEEREITGIKTLKAGEAVFSQLVGDQLIISQAKAGTTAQIVSLTGSVYLSQTLTDGQNVINVLKLQPGTYVLKVGDTSIKFIKK